MKLKVTRKVEFKTEDFCVGDQITVKLKGYGKYTATVQRVTDKGILFLFDEVLAQCIMNSSNTNEGGFDKSNIARWLGDVLLPSFPKKLRDKVSSITLPTYGEIFGHDDFYDNFDPDDDEQFESMKHRGNRVCDFNGDWCSWWLRNATKKEVSSAYFAYVSNYGNSYYAAAANSHGVRPEFWLVR